jgi:acyl-CoA reductase-like NAD-dependent aldehyde dehydrogenase
MIGGEWRKGRSQRMLEDRSPYTGEALEVIKQGDRDDLNDAYFAALEAHPQLGFRAAIRARRRHAPGRRDYGSSSR